MTSLALFNNKGGVGTTTLTYHVAHMMQRLGRRVLAVDLDPQSNLTAAFLDDDELGTLWGEADGSGAARPELAHAGTVAAAVRPIMEGTGGIAPCEPVPIVDGLWLLAGDLRLSAFEDDLAEQWTKGLTGDETALSMTTAFYRLISAATEVVDADLTLIDLGPNLGAINRAALLATDAVLVPLTADLPSLRALQVLGPALRGWRMAWRRQMMPDIDAPKGAMVPLGYVVMRTAMYLNRPGAAQQRWLDEIRHEFPALALDGRGAGPPDGSYEIGTVRENQTLLSPSRDARKPIFDLRAADGAVGSVQSLVQRYYKDFRVLSESVLDRLSRL
jgi:chromosome partitioning protein